MQFNTHVVVGSYEWVIKLLSSLEKAGVHTVANFYNAGYSYSEFLKIFNVLSFTSIQLGASTRWKHMKAIIFVSVSKIRNIIAALYIL